MPYIKPFSYTNAKKSSRWRNLFDAPRHSVTFHFTNSDSGWHNALYLDRPWHQPLTDTIYWAEEVNIGPEDENGIHPRGCYVYSHTPEDGVTRINDEPKTRAEAVASAMFLAAV